MSVHFEDNRVLAEVFGEYDANLALLEERLAISIVAHGNIVSLSGSRASCEIARDVLKALYERAAGGHSIGRGDVDGALRHVHAEPDAASLGDPAAGARRSRPQAAGMAHIRTRRRHINARTKTQSAYINALEASALVFGTGPAGTGKTYLAVAYAASFLERGLTDRIILSRPAVEAGERLGFLPGDMRDKVDPYLRPLYDALYDVLPPEKVERGLETGTIEIAPLAFMRGRTLTNAFVILDEAQNCTNMQMKMFLTRLGENSRMIVTGDPSQVDLPAGQASGLLHAIKLLENVDGIEVIRFTEVDVVRCELVARIVAAYDRAGMD